MNQLALADLVVLIVYIVGVVAFGSYFVRRSRSTKQFMVAGGRLPGWAVGLSIFGTYLSSLTFIGVPGKAYWSNWNSFVFSLSLPIAAFIAVKFFIPFYRKSGEISAYHHLERRFGPWARTFGVSLFLLNQVARIGAILFGVALALRALIGWEMQTIIIVTGILVTFYTLIGGIEAVIWTDVVQSIILTVGAVVVAVMLLAGMPEGPGQVFTIGMDAEPNKFGLGDFGPSLTTSTFWVVLFYGIFINLNNFGINQAFVQRYHTAKTEKDAARSVWFGALLYVPVGLLFFFIGACLFAYYQTHPTLLADVTNQVAVAKQIAVAEVTPEQVGDKIMPHFIVNHLPMGLAGLLIAAIFAAAMSSIDTSLNSSATVILTDLYRRFLRPDADEKESMGVLYCSTLLWGVLGTGVGLALIGVDSLLDAWWILEGVVSAGILGLFLLGFLSRRAGNLAALVAVTVGILVIGWLAVSPDSEKIPEFIRGPVNLLPDWILWFRSPFHGNTTIVFGVLTILAVGLVVSRFVGKSSTKS